MKNILGITRNELALWKSPSFIIDALFSFSLFIFAIIINYYAVRYATTNASNPVNDIVLAFLPNMDTSFFHGEVATWLKRITLAILILRPKFFNFAFKALAFTIIVRSLFINLTNLGIPVDGNPIQSFYTFGGDLFFSGHVALPFMLALVFWEVLVIRWFFIIKSLLMGLQTLLGNYHYSIDVFAAPFIVFTLYYIAKKYLVSDMNYINRSY